MTSVRELLSPESTVTLFELKWYLLSIGWIEERGDIERWLLFTKTDSSGNKIELALPNSDNLADSGRRKTDVLNALAQIQSRRIEIVAENVVGFSRDTFQFRLLNIEDSDALPLDTAQHYVKGLKNLYLYSACSEVKPRAYFEQPLPKAIDQLEKHRFGHTFRGSFGFSVYSQVLSENQTSDLLKQPPMSRRVTERIARGLLFTRKATEKDDPNILVAQYKSALNAKMCDALLEMSMKGEASFACEVAWANSIQPKEELTNIETIKISTAESEVLEYASELLRSVEPEPQEFVGHVTNLHCPRNPEDEASKRVVAVKGVHQEHETIEVRIELGRARYLQAIEAHKCGSNIRVSGILERKGSTWIMHGIRKFNIVDV